MALFPLPLPLPLPPLTLLPQHLSASERNPITPSNFNLKLNHPLLSRLESCTGTAQLRQLHAQMITTGLVHETFASSRLIAFCALSLHGDLGYALALFRQIPDPNLFIWNAMIRAFSRSNHPEFSIQFYVAMLQSCCVPDSYTFPFVLKSCSHLSACSEGRQIHAHVLKTGLEDNPFVSNSLIHMYAELGCVEHARLVFEKMPEGDRSEVTWAAMIDGLVNNDHPKKALALFCLDDWRKRGVDQITLATVLSACARVRDLKLGKEIHCYIEQRGVGLNLILTNSLMNMYAKCGDLDSARLLFRDMPEKDSISWNILLSGLVENGCFEEGLELFAEMKSRDMRVNEATFLCLVSACGELDLGIAIHSHIRDMGLEPNISICNALIGMYSRTGNVEIAREVFDKMSDRDSISWNSIIAGYARCGSMENARLHFNRMPQKDNFSWSTMILGYVRNDQPKEAIRVYRELLAEGGSKPDKVTMLSVLTACSHLGALEEGRAAHLYIHSNGMQIDIALGTALIDMYAKCGCLVQSVEVFKSLSERDVFTWTALISGLAMHGCGKEALQVFIQMQNIADESTKPNSITFLSVLSACAHAGLVEDGKRIYYSMADCDIEPEMVHIGCMVDLLGRAGLLDEAVELIASLGYEVDAHVWGALLGACKIHGNVKLGEIAYKKILELEPRHEGAHVLLSNIYAEAGQWKDSKETRRKMKDENILKEVGRSCIEVNGILHEFIAGDIFRC